MLFVSSTSGESALEFLLQKCRGNLGQTYPYHFELVIADYLRKNLRTMSVAGEDREPVYITKLTNTVIKQLSPLLPYTEIWGIPPYTIEQLKDIMGKTLNILKDIKDVIDIGNGFLAPGPIRFIDIPNCENSLVVGCITTYNLNLLFKTTVRVSGFARFVDKISLLNADIQYPIQWQQFDDWTGYIPPDLNNWTREIIKYANENLLQSAANYENFEVYCPWFNNKLQYFKWLSYQDFKKTIDSSPKELLLFRSKSSLGPRSYWFGRFSSATLEAEAEVSQHNVRRILYGLDLFYNNETEASWTGNIITFKNNLPEEELRLLYAVGLDCSPEQGKLPLMFDIHPEWKNIVNEKLHCLGLKI